MKKITLIIALMTFSFLAQSQTDLEIATLLLGKNISQVDTILSNLEVEYYITDKDKNSLDVYIVKNNSTRVWGISYSDIYNISNMNGRDIKIQVGEDLIYEVFIRYKHSNMNDLKEFYAYEVPESTRFIKYDKLLGKNMSHLKVIHVGYYSLVTKN